MKDLLPALLLLHAPLLHAEIAILNEEYSYQGSDLVQVFENQKNQLFVNVGSNWEDYSISITGNVVAIDGNSIYTFSQVGDMSNISSATNVITSPINWTGITRDPSNGTVLALDPTGSRVLRFPLLSDLSDSNNATETHILDDAIPWRGFEIAADGKVYALNSRNSMLCIFASLNDWVNGQDPVDSITVGKEWKGIGKADAQPLPSSLDTSLSAFSSLPRNLASSSAYEIVGAYPSLTFTDPSAMVAHPSGDGFLVSERIGRIYHIDQDEFSSRKDLVLDIRPNVAISHDSGLYNFCFHPDYLNNGYIYVYYTWLPAGLSIPTDFNAQQEADYFGVFLRLSRFTVDPQTGTVDHSTELPMFHVRLYNGSHRGSGLVFGDDGMLYLAIGEQFRKFKAQDIRNTFDGGVLRIDVDMQGGTVSHPPIRKMGIDAGEPDEFSGVGYYIPSDNPFLAADGSIFEEFATLGNRNPYRMSKDRDTGEIFIAEVGDRNREEVNRLVIGANYQWPYREGFKKRSDTPATYDGVWTHPIIDFDRSQSSSITGGLVYRGTRFPELNGKFICGEYNRAEMFIIDTSAGTYEVIPGLSRTVGFGEDVVGGNIYFFTGKTGGNVVRGISKLQSVRNPTEPPALLSQTGVFSDLGSLQPQPGFIPYEPISPLWTDGAEKLRWVGIPSDGNRDQYQEIVLTDEIGQGRYPAGTVFIKHFELENQRIETRLMVMSEGNGWYGLSYRWRADESEAELVAESGADASLDINGTSYPWRFPSRTECFQCHTEAAGEILGFRSSQLNHDLFYHGGHCNQLTHLTNKGILRPGFTPAELPNLPTYANLGDSTASIEDRVRSYLASNCSHCHQPNSNGGRAEWDGRFETPLSLQQILRGNLIDTPSVPNSKVVIPGVPEHSEILTRILSLDTSNRMPPLATYQVDEDAARLIAQWIFSLTDAIHEEDSDSDGLSDELEMIKASGDLNRLNGGEADADRDGFSDRDELLAGTSPLDPKDKLFLDAVVESNSPLLRWEGRLGRVYCLESSPNLQNWKTIAETLSSLNETWEIEDPNAASHHFYRLNVSKP